MEDLVGYAERRARREFDRRIRRPARRQAIKYAMRAGAQYLRRAAPYAARSLGRAALRAAPIAARGVPYLGAAITAGEVAYHGIKAIRKRNRQGQIKVENSPRFEEIDEEMPDANPPDVDMPNAPEAGIKDTTASGKVMYGRVPRVKGATRLGIMRRRRSVRRRRPSRKRVFAKRVKKIIASVAEEKYKDAPTATTSFAGWNHLTGRYEFSNNYPDFGVLKLCLKEHFPLRGTLGNTGTANDKNTFMGRRVHFTGYSITGILHAEAGSQADGFVRLHLMSLNNKKFPLSTDPSYPNGTGINVGRNWYDDTHRSMGAAQLLATPTQVDNPVGATHSALNFFDNSNGDRFVDVAGDRIGAFNHGYRIHAGFKIIRSITLDAHDKTSANNLSRQVHPFKFFVPLNKTFKDLEALPETDFTARMPRLYILVEIVRKNAADAADSGFKVTFNPPRLHFRDHA